MNDCIFCKIIKGEIKSDILFENKYFIVINDISHKAEKHYLIIPKEHFKCLNEVNENRLVAINSIYKNLPELETKLGLEDGYRMVVNQRDNAGQTVNHLHFHLLGGQKLTDNFN